MPQSFIEDNFLERKSFFPESFKASASLSGPRVDEFLGRTFPQLFAEQVEQHPHHIAVQTQSGQLSYAELDEPANQLANYLRGLGVGRESLVAICIDRSLEMAIGIIGILKSGAAYLPLDPDYPRERLALMLHDAQPAVILTTSKLAESLPANDSHLVLFDDDATTIQAASRADAANRSLPRDLAYVIYTSGSTGTPKGVMIEHGNLANYLLGLNQNLHIQADDVYLHLASIAFSSSRRQLLLPLSQGATVVIASSEDRKDPLALFEMIKRRGVTIMDAVPSFWRSCTMILNEVDPSTRRELLNNRLRLMLSASEPLMSDIPRTWMIHFQHPARHVHMFGQTETAGIVCMNEVALDESDYEPKQISIGNPIANTEILILDEQMNLCPMGTAGELYIAGAGVGRGYLNRPDLTAEKFLENPFTHDHKAQLYRTGDWVRLRKDGRLEFAGRRDQQIKVRGFRVELPEIEATLARHVSIRETAVVARPSADGIQRLVAYFAADANLESRELRDFLHDELPEYAVPSAFIQLDSLPLSANGKVNRRALLELDEPQFELVSEYVAPRNDLEEQLVAIWKNLLHAKQVGIDDNFFELGGNSLLAGQAIARVRRMFKVRAPVTWVFQAPTVRDFARQLEAENGQHDASEELQLMRVSRERPLPLSFSQQQLWFLDQLDSGSHAYNLAHAMEIRGALDIEALHQALDAIVARHEILRTRFVEVNGMPFQQIDLPAAVEWQFVDLSRMAQPDSEAQAILETESRKSFNLASGPLLRTTLVRLTSDRFILLLTMHHIVSDGWSDKVLINELSALYIAFTRGVTPSLSELSIQYADYAVWQRESVDGGKLERQLDYWKQELDDAPPLLNLPTDFPRGSIQSYRGGKETVRLSREVSERVRKFARVHGVTLFMTLLAAFDVLMAIYSGADDVVVGSPVAGRDGLETELLIGFFVNTLALRARIRPDLTVRELMNDVRRTTLDAFTNQNLPFEKLVTALQRDRSLDHNPIFQVMFVLQHGKQPVPVFPGASVRSIDLKDDTSKFDLSLEAVDDDEIELSISYSADLFESQSASLMLADYQRLLETFIANADGKVSQLARPTWKPKHAPAQNVSPIWNTAGAYVAPRTPIEDKLAAIWIEVLGSDRIGVHDNFFALGGHSLLATQVIARIRSAFDYELPLRRLFETPTIAGLADAICENHAATTEDDELQALLAELETLSDDEAQRQFANERAA